MRMISKLLDSNGKSVLLGKVVDSKHSFSVSELARFSSLPKATVSRIVKDWEEAGLISMEFQGRNKLVKINKKFYLLPELIKIFGKAANFQAPLIARLKKATLKKPEIKAIVVFGSRARGDFNSGSDLDILVATGKKSAETEELFDELARAATDTGVSFSPVFLNSGEIRSRLLEKDSFILNVLSQGKIIKGEKWLGNIQAASRHSKRKV